MFKYLFVLLVAFLGVAYCEPKPGYLATYSSPIIKTLPTYSSYYGTPLAYRSYYGNYGNYYGNYYNNNPYGYAYGSPYYYY